jgi:hypothetical protein
VRSLALWYPRAQVDLVRSVTPRLTGLTNTLKIPTSFLLPTTTVDASDSRNNELEIPQALQHRNRTSMQRCSRYGSCAIITFHFSRCYRRTQAQTTQAVCPSQSGFPCMPELSATQNKGQRCPSPSCRAGALDKPKLTLLQCNVQALPPNSSCTPCLNSGVRCHVSKFSDRRKCVCRARMAITDTN